MKTTFIYGLVDPADPWEIRYVGRTQNLEKRMRQHFCAAVKTSKKHNLRLSLWIAALLADGRAPQATVLADTKLPADAERSMIIKLLADGHRLFNIKRGGCGSYSEVSKGVPKSAAHKTAIGAASAARFADPEFREANRQKQIATHRTDEYRARASDLAKAVHERRGSPTSGFTGRMHSLDTRAKISASLKGRKRPPEEVAKIVAFHTGRKRSPETCRRISEAIKASFEKRQSLSEV